MKTFAILCLLGEINAIQIHKPAGKKEDFVPKISNASDKEIGYKKREIIDSDGDGVEDNKHLTHHELDRFRNPNYFNPVEEMHNTHNGELPGHIRKSEIPQEPKGKHASEVLGSPYEAELKASTYPGTPAAAPAKEEKKEAAAAPAEPAAAAPKEEAKAEAAAAPVKEEAKEKAAEPAKAEEAPAKEAKPAEEKKLQLDSVIRFDGAPSMSGQAFEVSDIVSAAMNSPISEDHLKAMGALVQREYEPVEVQTENDEENLLQLEGQQLKLSAYINNIQSPEDLALIQFDTQKAREQEEYTSGMIDASGKRGKGFLAGYNRITDADGDGVEDNEAWANDFAHLDKFYIPAVFGSAEEMYNTHHGNLPGHR